MLDEFIAKQLKKNYGVSVDVEPDSCLIAVWERELTKDGGEKRIKHFAGDTLEEAMRKVKC